MAISRSQFLRLLFGVCLCILTHGASVDPSVYPQDVQVLMNLTADPCQDFYEYACGGWLSNTTLPPQDSVLLRAITSIEVANSNTLLAVMQNSSSQYPKIGAFFKNCMDTDLIEKLGNLPLMNVYNLMQVTDLESFMAVVGFLHSFEIPALFAFSVVPDPGQPTVLIGEFDQGGIVLPDPTMYNPSDPHGQQLLSDYQKHITNMFTLVGESNPEDLAKKVLQLETQIAAATIPADQIRDPYSVYHKIDLDGLQTLSPDIPWSDYLYSIGAPSLTSLNVGEPTFFQALDKILTSTDAPTLEAHVKWNLLHATANLLSSDFVNETFRFFGTELNGQQAMDPRSTTCVAATDAALGNIVGDAFVSIAFGGASQEMVNTMIQDIENAFHSVLTNITWMDDQTKQQALTKLSKVTRRVGAPTNPSYYPGYDVIDQDYFMSTLLKQNYDFNATVSTLGQAPNKNQWQMTADTVNAYYNPPDNSINFPAGIMQFPYFAVTRDPAENFGGVGVIMGHELTHGFDDQGRMYDGDGKLTNWWSNFSADHFEASCRCLADQYSGYEVLPGVFVNGNLTLGENVADNGGVKNAYNAYIAFLETMRVRRAHRSGSSHHHHREVSEDAHGVLFRKLKELHEAANFQENFPLFFVSYAQGWCAKATAEYIKLLVATDVHSPPEVRAIGPLVNFEPFSETFSCPVGSRMNPVTKCVVW